MKLTGVKVQSAKTRDKSYKMPDGDGLFLLVHVNGSRYWRYRYTFAGKEKLLALGVYPAVSLAEARQKRDAAKSLVAKGINPTDDKRAAKVEQGDGFTFDTIARQWHATNLTWSEDHRSRVLRTLEQYIFPSIGSLDARTLRTSQLLAPIKAVDAAGKHDVAQRLQQRVTAIMRFGVQNDILESNPANDMTGALAVTKTTHHPALPPARINEFLNRLSVYRGRKITRLAVELTLLTFVRSSEMRFARWTEVDFKKKVWNIPGKREPLAGVKHSARGMKMKTDHSVPLSKQALYVLEQLHDLSGKGEVIFPSDHDPRKVMSENTVNNALRGMGYDTKTEVCGHGFRTMARGALGESRLWSDDAIERQLSHVERNNVRAAYKHTSEYIEERGLMLQWWADYLDACKKESIMPFEFARLALS